MGEKVPSEVSQPQVKKGCLQRMQAWFTQLSFWKKIIIIFTLNTVILLILTDAIMLTLFAKISNGIISTAHTQKEQFNQLSNSQITIATAQMVLSQIDYYAHLLNQLTSAHTYFAQNPAIYTSLETAQPPNPALTSSFSNTSYSQPAIYYYSNESKFVGLPTIDSLLPHLLHSHAYYGYVQRINVFVQNNQIPNDLTAHTFPATAQFVVPSQQDISNRFQGIKAGTFNLSVPYSDSLTTSNISDLLFAVRTLLPLDNTYNLLFQVQLQQQLLSSLLKQIYFFPSTNVLLLTRNSNQYIYYSNQPNDRLLVQHIDQLYQNGFHRIQHQDQGSSELEGNYVGATIGMANSYQLGSTSTVSNNTDDPLRLIIISKAAETDKPANIIEQFVSKQSNILIGIILAWSFVILLSTVALATVVGNYIFYNLKTLSTKMGEYIVDPSLFHNIVIELKELELKGILKRLSDNLIAIIEKIEVRKKERKDRINQNYHPWSVGQQKFQERQQLNDYEIIENIKKQVKEKVQLLKKQAAEKQRAEKEKAEKEKAQKEILQTQKAYQISAQISNSSPSPKGKHQ